MCQHATNGLATPRAPRQRGQHRASREESLQPVNLPVGLFSRAEQRVLQSIFKAIAEGGGRCVATLEMLARDSNTSKSTARNAIARAVAIGLLEKTEPSAATTAQSRFPTF